MPEVLTVPADLEPYAHKIHGSDPRFSSLLLDGVTLGTAVEAGTLDRADLDEVVVRARHLRTMTIEEQVQNVINFAYLASLGTWPSEKWSAGLAVRYGVHSPPGTLQVAGDVVGVTRERVRQVTVEIEPLVRGSWAPALDEILLLLVERSPLADPIGTVTATLGLSRSTLTGASLLGFVNLLGTDVSHVTGTNLVLADGWIVDKREVKVVSAAKVVSKHTSTFGMTSLEDVRQEVSTAGAPADLDDVRRVLQANLRIGWAGDWVWFNKDDDNSRANSMVNTIRSMLSVNTPQTVQSLQEGLRRNAKFRKRDIVPPAGAMATFLQQSPYFVVTDGLVSPVVELDYHAVHGEVAASIIDVLKASPFGVMDRASLYEACTSAGISLHTVTVWTSYAEWMEGFDTNVWGLRGSNPNPAVVAEVKKAAKTRHASEAHETRWSWSPEGAIILTMDVSTSARTTGTFAFDAQFPAIVGSRKFTLLQDNMAIGELSTSGEHMWTWGWHKAYAATGAKAGDVLQVTLDLATGMATVVKGGRELWS